MSQEKELEETKQELAKVQALLDQRIERQRQKALDAAFDFFDLDGSGELDEEEFFQIGQVV